MKSSILKTILIASFLLGASTQLTLASFSSANQKYEKANAETWSEKMSIRSMACKYAYEIKNNNPDANYVTADSGYYSYFVRHGHIEDGLISKYDNVTFVSDVNSSFSTNDSNQSKIVSGWQLVTSTVDGTTATDGVIFGVTAHEKMFFSADYSDLYGWTTDAYISWYIKKSGKADYELIKTVQLPSSSSPTASYAGLNRTILDVNDTIYWEFYHTKQTLKDGVVQPQSRNLQETGGKLLPVFNFSQYVELPTSTLTTPAIVTALSSNPTATSENGIVSYTVKNDSVTNNTYADATKGFLGSAGSPYHLSANELVLKNGERVTFELTVLEPAYVTLQLNEATKTTCDGLTLTGYFYKDQDKKTEKIYSTTYGKKFDKSVPQGSLLLTANDVLYIEYSAAANSDIATDFLPIFVIAQDVGKYDTVDFPKFSPRDYSSFTEINHETILRESARINCAPIETKNVDVSLLTGTVDESGEHTNPFSFIHYSGHEYVGESSSSEIATMYETEDKWNAPNGAGVEKDRIAFSISEYVIYKIEATIDTHIIINHDEIKTGWVNGKSIYVFGFQKIEDIYAKVSEINVPYVKLAEEPIAADYLKMEFNLKKDDIAYYAFGTTQAKNTNLNIKIRISSDTSKYDEAARTNVINTIAAFNKNYHDLVSSCVANKGDNLKFGLITVILGHGSPDDIQRMDVFAGEGKGGADDIAMTGIEANHLTKFERWQMRCGKDDDAIIKFVVGIDIHLTIVWRKEAEITSWATHTALKSYAVDTDGFLMLDQAKLCVNEGHGSIDDEYYNYDVHLKKGQGFLLDYTSMGASYGVIQYDFAVTATANDFDETKVFNFDEAKTLYNYCEQKINELRAIAAGLNEEDYSMVNWANIDEIYSKFVKEAKEATTTSEIDELFNTAKAKIEAVKTLVEEDSSLTNARENAKVEAREYLDSKKDSMSKENLEKAESLYTKFCSTVDAATSVSKINIELTKIKAQIDQLCDVQPNQKKCGGDIMATSIILSAISMIGACLIVIKKRKEL